MMIKTEWNTSWFTVLVCFALEDDEEEEDDDDDDDEEEEEEDEDYNEDDDKTQNEIKWTS